mmetsp:Transcript_88068/g.247573  ORF Transcript_88068/g.247573 Transcript_88068/m.247573 type:complete len:217 (-) Transcript_88068:323-973(-)
MALLHFVAALQLQVLLPTVSAVRARNGKLRVLDRRRKPVGPVWPLLVARVAIAMHANTREPNDLFVAGARPYVDSLAREERVVGEMASDILGQFGILHLRERDVVEMPRRPCEDGAVETVVAKKTNETQSIVVEVLVHILGTFQHMVAVDVPIHPLHDLLPTSALPCVVLEHRPIDEKLHRREPGDAERFARVAVAMHVNLCKCHRRVVELEFLNC